MFPSHLQGGYCVNCVPDGSWVHCSEVFKATWSEELSDKRTAVIYVWNKELHINVRLNQTVRLIRKSLEHPSMFIVLNSKGKIPQDWTIVYWHDKAGD